MGFIDAAILMAANFFCSGLRTLLSQSGPTSSVAFDTRSSLAFTLLGEAFSRRGGALMERGWMKNIQIIIFPVNIAKFTGFFDKFLKTNDEGIEALTDIISVSYASRLKQKMNAFSNFTELKKFFRAPHLPAIACISSRSASSPKARLA